MQQYKNRIEKTILLGAGLISVAMTPFMSYEPINLPRLVILTIFGLSLILLIAIHRKDLINSEHKKILLVLLSFIIWSLISSVFSSLGFIDAFYGVFGRNNALLTYLMFMAFIAATIFVSNLKFIRSLLLVMVFIGVLSASYGLMQSIGIDPFGWISENVIVFGFFGNPNFQASFMGITATVAFAYLLNKDYKLSIKLGYLAFIILALYIVYKSKSQQGYLVFIAGVSVVIYLWLRTNPVLKKFRVLYLFVLSFGVIAVLLDIFQKSPWSSFLYKESVSYRGDFWQAGWNMTISNPVFGVGLDGYRDNFRFYRDQTSADRNPNSFVDSAHNVFLDISSGGGFPLLVIYITLLVMVLVSARKVIKRSTTFDYNFAALFASWVAYTAQSLISIQQIGIAIWGWVLAGAIIGYEINSRKDQSVKLSNRDASEVLAGSAGLILGLIISLPPFIADAQFRSTVLKGEITKIESALQRWPQNVSNMNFASDLFRKGGFPDQALDMARKAVALNPRNFEAWQQIFLSQNAPESERNAALMKMREMDPFNSTLK
jgi:O-antigen ligase